MIDPRISKAFERDCGFPLEPNLLVLATMGSHSHGTFIPSQDSAGTDDVDFMGFVTPPSEYHLGLPRWQHWLFKYEELDVVLYSLDKAIRLLLKSNPNIVGMLWLRDEDYLVRTSISETLLQRRNIFSSRELATAFMGYAEAQFKKMEAFDTKRMDEYERMIRELGGPEIAHTAAKADNTSLQELSVQIGKPIKFLLDFRTFHRRYFSGYMGEKRKAIVRLHGYDTKNAAHLIRLLRMGVEFLETGVLQVFRTYDAEELREIKQGFWSLEEVKKEATRLFATIREAEKYCALPQRPDTLAAGKFLEWAHRQWLGFPNTVTFRNYAFGKPK